MRKLPLLLALLLTVLLGTTVPAQAAAPPPADQLVPLPAPEDDEKKSKRKSPTPATTRATKNPNRAATAKPGRERALPAEERDRRGRRRLRQAATAPGHPLPGR